MKRSSFILVSGFWILASQISQSIVDTNNNTLSDLWEKHFNSGNLYPDLDPLADSDGDDWTNAQEAAAGTHPFDANPPAGILRPDFLHIPETWADTNGDGILEHTPAAITLTWVTIPGKQYAVLYSLDLSEGSWQPLGESFIGNGTQTEIGLPFTQSGGNTPDKYFWRVALTDIDTDSDGLTDAEEYLHGSNSGISDTDSDGTSDFEEYGLGTSPTVPRIWAFKETRNDNGTVTFTWNSYAANGDWFNIESQEPNGTWHTIYETTYGSTKLPYVPGSHSYSLTLNPATDYQP